MGVGVGAYMRACVRACVRARVYNSWVLVLVGKGGGSAIDNVFNRWNCLRL